MTCCLDPSLLYSKDLKYSTQTSTLLLQYGFSLTVEKFVKSNFGISLCSPQLVGVRIPDHNFMRRLCQMCGEPLALTSANISSHTSTVAVHVSAQCVKKNKQKNKAFVRITYFHIDKTKIRHLFFLSRNFRSSGPNFQWWWMADQSGAKAASAQQWLTYQRLANTASSEMAGEFMT